MANVDIRRMNRLLESVAAELRPEGLGDQKCHCGKTTIPDGSGSRVLDGKYHSVGTCGAKAKTEAGPIRGQSPRHVWKMVAFHGPRDHVARCDRCGAHYVERADGAHGPMYCKPTPAWMKAHPEDDGKER